MPKKTIAVDFDGTIARYDGWQGVGKFGDPMPGAKEALQELKDEGCFIIIWTTRSEEYLIETYLNDHEIPYDLVNLNHPDAPENIGDKKVWAQVYIDDRALQFDGNWKGMVDKALRFEKWYDRRNQRPSSMVQVAGYHMDQLSLYVRDIAKAIQEYSAWGHGNWVEDIVNASGRAGDFQVHLAFNYTLFPFEFELLQVLSGQTVQVPRLKIDQEVHGCGLSHYGFHVSELGQAVVDFEACGYRTMDVIETTAHSGCPYLYTYAFMDTRKLGFIAKLIKRKDS